MASLDLYRILQVDPTAEPEVIRAAFLSLAKKYHPDSTGGGDSARMIALNEAWEVLGDPVRRAEYDNQVRVAAASQEASPSGAHRERRESPSSGAPIKPSFAPGARPNATGTVIDFGRYAGSTLESIARHDPEYLEWLARAQIGRQYRTEIYSILASRAAAGVPIGRTDGRRAGSAARDEKPGWGIPWRRAWAEH